MDLRSARQEEEEDDEKQLGLNTIGNSFSKENLKKWKSLEGDWKTFRDVGSKETLLADRFDTPSSDSRQTPELSSPTSFIDGEYEQEWRSLSPSSTEDRHEKEGRRNSNIHDSSENLGIIRSSRDNKNRSQAAADDQSSFNKERCNLAPPATGRCNHEDINSKFKSEYGPLFEDVVNSSYPLLKENFSLLEKFKKERDVCRQLESDMRNLEGQIQDVSKSFELEIGGKESENESDGGYSFELGPDSPHLSNSLQHIYENEEMIEEAYEEEGGEDRREAKTDPALIVEETFSRLLLLADRLENVVRTSDLDFVQLQRDSPLTLHTSPREWDWMERCHVLTRISVELRCMLNELQAALRQLLVSKGWWSSREYGDRECTSPGSSTSQGFLSSQVIVPTVRAIFTQVGDSIELRPIEDDPNDRFSLEGVELLNDPEKAPRSPSTQSSSPKTSSRNHTSDHSLFENYGNSDLANQNVFETEIRTKENDQIGSCSSCLQDEESEVSENLCMENLDVEATERMTESKDPHTRSFSEIVYSTNYDHSSEIIKRIERLQELVRPELCESLKQRALRIQRAKEEFLCGFSMPAPSHPLTAPTHHPSPTHHRPASIHHRPASSPALEILIQEIPSLPNGLIVKCQEDLPVEEEKRERIVFPFLKKKWKDWSRDKLSTESLVLDDKSDWLRNPFRPKGKYKISK